MMESFNLAKNILVCRGFVGYLGIISSKPDLVNNILRKFQDTK
jgi:hypothetical protein